MLASNLELVQHILVETAFILNHTENKTKDEVVNDEVLCRAVVRSIEIIGEASKKIDDEFKSIHHQIEWKKIAGTRDKLIHDYFGIDYDIVWDILENKIPDLDHFLRHII
ncbi:MAG: HepT-like ribonuclease domain-containing protein [Sediminibacterium sp.]